MDGKSYRISFADMQKQTGCEREQRQVILKQEYQLSDYLNKRADSVTDHDSSSDSKSNSSSKNHYGSMIKKLFFIHRQPVKASKFGKKELFEFSQIDHLWNNLWCAPFFYLFNGCKKPNTSKVFSQLYDRLMRDICVIDLIKRQNKMLALITSLYASKEPELK